MNDAEIVNAMSALAEAYTAWEQSHSGTSDGNGAS